MSGYSPRLVVVGGGVAGLSAARTALALRPDLDVHVLERAPRLGGLIETEYTPEGFVVEHGADCIVTAKPAGVAAVEQAGLAHALAPPMAGAATTFIARGRRLLPLPPGVAFGAPSNVLDVLCSRALSTGTKLRMALEPWREVRADDADESVAAFVARRFGNGFLEQVVAPVLEGVYGAPASELSALACLPRLRALEQRGGSVLRGLRKGASAGPPAPAVMTLRDGMESLVRALAGSMRQRVHTSVDVAQIERARDGGFRVQTRDGARLDSDALIIATPAHAAAALAESLSAPLAAALGSVRYSRLDCVSLAFRRADVPHALNGSGFVVPSGHRRLIRACTWSSSKWSGRAPQGYALVRCVLDAGGHSDDALLASVREELRDVLGVEANPALMRLRRRRQGLPIHEVGSVERAAALELQARDLGAFALAGSAHGAMGVADCVESGRRAARSVLAELGAPC